LTATDESGNGNFGYSVALSADGNTALIGGYRTATVLGGVGVHAHGGLAQQGSKLTGAARPEPASSA